MSVTLFFSISKSLKMWRLEFTDFALLAAMWVSPRRGCVWMSQLTAVLWQEVGRCAKRGGVGLENMKKKVYFLRTFEDKDDSCTKKTAAEAFLFTSLKESSLFSSRYKAVTYKQCLILVFYVVSSQQIASCCLLTKTDTSSYA